jgi:hypothetical protein
MHSPLQRRTPSVYDRFLLCACRRIGVSVLAILALVVVTGCEATTGASVASTTAAAAAATATTLPAPTATLTPDAAFRDEIATITSLRSLVPASRPGFEIEQLADVTVMHVFIQLSSPTLPDVQWDAFRVQRALWSDQEFVIPDGWEVSVEFFVAPPNAATTTLGQEIGVANLHTASARRFAWDSLSPQQAWSHYDGVAFNQNGL